MTNQAFATAMWFPVISTLVAAVAGFLASSLLSFLNHRQVETKELANRQRERLEDLYKTLLLIRNEYLDFHGKTIFRINHYSPMTAGSRPDVLPPIIKTEMLVKLYFPCLNPELSAFLKARDNYGKEWAELILASTTSWPIEKRKEKTTEFLELYGHIDKAISIFQLSITKSIKP